MEIEIPEGMTEKEAAKLLSRLVSNPSPTQSKLEPKVFKDFESRNDRLKVYLDHYKGKEVKAIRRFYLDKDSQEFRPGKGVTFTYEDIDEIIEGLQEMKAYLEDIVEEKN